MRSSNDPVQQLESGGSSNLIDWGREEPKRTWKETFEKR